MQKVLNGPQENGQILKIECKKSLSKRVKLDTEMNKLTVPTSKKLHINTSSGIVTLMGLIPLPHLSSYQQNAIQEEQLAELLRVLYTKGLGKN
jgi:hypothetical protein